MQFLTIPPPIPFSLFPGITQFARSPVEATSIDPIAVISKCLPLIIPNDVVVGNNELPGIVVTVAFPAFTMSASSYPGFGKSPIPSNPFSLCSIICTSEERNFGIRVGIPIPRFTYIPLFNSLAARLAIRSLANAPAAYFLLLSFGLLLLLNSFFLGSLRESISMRFSRFLALTIRSTKIPGV